MVYKNYIKSLRENDKASIAEIIRLMESSGCESVDFPKDEGNEVTAYIFEEDCFGATCEIIQGIRLHIDEQTACKYLILEYGNGKTATSCDCHEGTMPYIHAAVVKVINMKKIELLEQPISSLGLKTHMINVFDRENVKTVADLCMCSYRRLLKIRGISQSSVKEIRNKLNELDMDFGSDLKMLGFYPKDIYLHK